MDKPLRLRKPKAVKNWFRSGRWHKIRPRPGRTQFRFRDLCQFKPDLLDVEVEDVIKTAEKDLFLYRVRALNSGHPFSTYGSDLVLLKRHKPVLVEKLKPVFVLRPKPKPKRKVKPVLIILHRSPQKPRFIKPEKDVAARLSLWCDWGAFPNQWAYIDFKNESEVEKEFWDRVEERYPRRRKRYVRKSNLEGIYTDRYHHPELVCIEWFPPYYQPQQENENASRKRAVSPEKAVLRGRSRNNGGGTATKDQAKGKAKQPVHPRKPTQPKGHRKSQKARTVRRAKAGGNHNQNGRGKVRAGTD